MMKLTVAFLAALATADAAQAHGRRHHVRRQGDYGYGNGGYGGGYPVNPPPAGTGSPSSTAIPAVPSDESSTYPPAVETPAVPTPPVVPSSSEGVDTSAIAIGVSSSSIYTEFPTFPGTGYPVPSPPVESPPVDSTGLPNFPGTGNSAFPTAYPTAYPTGSGSFPVTDVANSTGSPDVTTSTIYSTQISTVIGCPQTVTDCPASSTHLVTSVVAIATTVCPKTTEGPSSTAIPANEQGEEVIETSVTEITHTITETLVYTVGTGPSAHPATTEVVSTSTETVYETVTITHPGSGATPTPGSSEEYPSGSGEEDYPEGTTTISSTSTTTKYITVYPSASGTPVDTEDSSAIPAVPTSGAGEGEEEGECAAPVTVTVTAQETVTVTATPDEPTPDVPATDVPSNTGEVTSEYPVGTPSPSVPYPFGNSTAYPTGGSTGFLTYTKPAEGTGYPVIPVPSGTGVPSVPEDTALPSFHLPSGTDIEAVPESTAIPAVPSGGETDYPSTSADAVVPTPTPGNGYGSYGSYRKRFGLF